MIKIQDFSRKLMRLLSILISAIMVVGFIAPFNATTAFALDVPQPIFPLNSSLTTSVTDPPLGVPSFSWTAVVGATDYRLQVDSDIGFGTPIVLNITTKNTSYTPALTAHLFADGEWYWRVRVEKPLPVGEWSEIMTFTKSWATGENSPTLIAPLEGALLAFFTTPDFSWSRVIGAAKYRFQIAISSEGFNAPIFWDDTLSTNIQPEVRLENGDYWWRVIPMDTADHLGTISEVRQFSLAYGTSALGLIPTLIDPKDETTPTFTPTFQWTAVEGAEHYRLEYTSDETCDFSLGTGIDTRQTTYTPTDTFPNDKRYCWRVRAESGAAVGDWSDTWHFQKKWYLQPQLLTPTDRYNNGLYPLFSWTPVPGASRYRIDINLDQDFTPPVFETYITANTTYAPQMKYYGTQHYYWQVTPIDGGGELGLTSEVAEFQSNYNSTAPILVYPLYYYPPNDPNYNEGNLMNPVEDRTVAYPVFMWHRVITPNPVGGNYAVAYRIQVDTTPYFNDPWQFDTENTSFSPSASDGFIPHGGQDYFWHVCVLDFIGGSCLEDQYAGWSQTWRTRFDPSLALQPTNGDAPELLRPDNGQETVEATPLLEWWPYQEITRTQYIIEISRDSAFSSTVLTETVDIPSYAPSYSLAQRSLGRTDYGTFYWRVKGSVGGNWSGWSDVRRFQIASQSEWRYTRTLGDPSNRLLIGNDPVGDALENYDLNTLYAAQQGGNPLYGIPAYWFLGFTATMTSTDDMTYVFYIDLDRIDGSGATTPPPLPRNYNVTTIPAHQPEFAIYVDKINGVVSDENTWVYAWNGIEWEFGERLSEIGGFVYASDGYVELQLLNSTIGMSQVTGSASVILFSVDSAGIVQDSVPSDPQAPGNAQLSRFSAVSERMNLISPPSTATGDPHTIPSLLPFFWDWPTGSNDATPFAGSRLEVHKDPSYTSLAASYVNDDCRYNDKYLSWNNVTLGDDIDGDNIYYWRVQPRYKTDGCSYTPPEIFGTWTMGWSFRRLGFTAQNLHASFTLATPTFSWDMAEGASSYLLQVSTDPNFGSFAFNPITTPMTSYTPPVTLAQGTYHFRVKVNRYNNIGNDWSEVAHFDLSLPTPTGLTPDFDPSNGVPYAPTLCWLPIKEPTNDPILSAWKYKVQVSRDENFSTIFDSITTINSCWTPTIGYFDGTYWWHVAMVDGNGKLGPYSPSATFTKQYPITTLISPIGESVPGTPTFVWTPVDGAATYVFEVSKYSTFSPPYDTIKTINTQFTPTKIYDSDLIYYWRVAIVDRSGMQGPFTDATIIIGAGNYFYLPLITR
jgi:hypothetical protein